MIFFIDIETASWHKSIETLDETSKEIFFRRYASSEIKFEGIDDYMSKLSRHYDAKAPLIPEFGRIVCITIGYIHKNTLKLKSCFGGSEHKILSEFNDIIAGVKDGNEIVWCGHCIKDFDIPYICKRMVINKLPIPNCLNFSGKKPWEINAIDTADLWKFGSYSKTALETICHVLGIESPKTEMDGSMVSEAFFEKRYKDIAVYCEGDVVATARVAIRLKPEIGEFAGITSQIER